MTTYNTAETNEREPDELITRLDRSFGDKIEELRISIGTFKGNKFISCRVFWKTQDGTYAPGKSGVAIKRKELDAVVSALQQAKAKLG